MLIEVVISDKKTKITNTATGIHFPVNEVTVRVCDAKGKEINSVKLNELNEKTTHLFGQVNAFMHPVLIVFSDGTRLLLSEEETINLIGFFQKYRPENRKNYGSESFIREMAYQRNSDEKLKDDQANPYHISYHYRTFIRATNPENFDEKKLAVGEMVQLFDEENRDAKGSSHFAMYLGKGFYLSLFGTRGPLIVTTLNAMGKGFYTNACVSLRKDIHAYTPMTKSDKLRYFLREVRKQAYLAGLPMPAVPPSKALQDENTTLSDNRLRMEHFLYHAGVLNSPLFYPVLLHPFQRALFLSIKNQNAYFSAANFRNPLQGLPTTLYKWQMKQILHIHTFQHLLKLTSSEVSFNSWTRLMHTSPANVYSMTQSPSQFSLRLLAGGVSNAILHPITTAKYHLWSKEKGSLWIESAFKLGFKKMVTTGFIARMSRDVVCAGGYHLIQPVVYRVLQNNLDDVNNSYVFALSASISAGFAGAIGSPLNYFYLSQLAAASKNEPLSMRELFKNTLAESKKNNTSFIGKANFFRQQIKPGVHMGLMAGNLALAQLLFNPAVGLQRKFTDIWCKKKWSLSLRETRREIEKEKLLEKERPKKDLITQERAFKTIYLKNEERVKKKPIKEEATPREKSAKRLIPR